MGALDEGRLAELESAARAATPGPWSVFDMDEAGKMKGEPVNEPGEGWYWVWADKQRPYYAGVLEMEQHHPDCGKAVGSAEITDAGGKQTLADAAHIAAASPDVVLALVAEVRAARAALGRVEALSAEWDALCPPGEWPEGGIDHAVLADAGRMVRDALAGPQEPSSPTVASTDPDEPNGVQRGAQGDEPEVTWVDLFGIDPDFTDGKDISEWLDEQRGEA